MNEPLVFTAEDLTAILEPDLGHLQHLKIVPPADPSSTTAKWSAVNMDNDPVNGAVEVQLEQRGDGTFVVTPVVTIAGASGRRLELPWTGGRR